MNQGDLVDVSRKLRRLLADYDTAAYVLSASFFEVDPELEAAAADLRPTVDDSRTRLYHFLGRLEKSPKFIAARAEAFQEHQDD